MSNLKQLRVAEVISGLAMGGTEVALIRRLRVATDLQTTVINTQPKLSGLEQQLPANVEIVHWASRWTSGMLWRTLRGRADVVISHTPLESLLLLLARRRSDPPLIVMAHLDAATTRRGVNLVLNRAFRMLNRRARLHVAVSPAAAAGPLCRAAREVVVIPLGATVDFSAEAFRGWQPGTKLKLVSIGRYVHQKNMLGLVAAASSIADELRAAQTEILIIGYGPQESELIAEVTKCGVQDFVRILGPMPDPSDVLLSADTVVIASRYEGGPLTLYEALLAGCRVVSTPVGIAPLALQEDSGSHLAGGVSSADVAECLLKAVQLGPVTDECRQARQQANRCWNSTASAVRFYEQVDRIVA